MYISLQTIAWFWLLPVISFVVGALMVCCLHGPKRGLID